MFNEVKYNNCIKHLVALKTFIIVIYAIIFLFLGGIIGFAIGEGESSVPALFGGILGLILGIIIGVNSTWRIEMKIQESYWRIDMLRETKKNKEIDSNPIEVK